MATLAMHKQSSYSEYCCRDDKTMTVGRERDRQLRSCLGAGSCGVDTSFCALEMKRPSSVTSIGVIVWNRPRGLQGI